MQLLNNPFFIIFSDNLSQQLPQTFGNQVLMTTQIFSFWYLKFLSINMI